MIAQRRLSGMAPTWVGSLWPAVGPLLLSRQFTAVSQKKADAFPEKFSAGKSKAQLFFPKPT